MERITYILGAGFSAPLGLPVMRDFLIKSKDLYFSDTDRYQHFLDVFDLINKLSVAKNYFDTDLFNIEEILSIIEMQQFVEQRRMRRVFSRYVCDVISHYTPRFLNARSYPAIGRISFLVSDIQCNQISDISWEACSVLALSLLMTTEGLSEPRQNHIQILRCILS